MGARLNRAHEVPHEQFGPQVHGEHVQSELAQPPTMGPQLQSGPQLHGEQVQFGLAQPPACSLVMVLMVDSFQWSYDGSASSLFRRRDSTIVSAINTSSRVTPKEG